MAERKLTDKQKRFCQEYIVDLNGTQAAIRAGYSAKTANEQASRMLAKVNIQTYIQSLSDNITEKLEITVEDILRDIIEVKDRCMQKYPVMAKIDGEWQETGEWQFEHNGALKSLEMLGKYKKMFTDKVEHSGQVAVDHSIITKYLDGDDD